MLKTPFQALSLHGTCFNHLPSQAVHLRLPCNTFTYSSAVSLSVCPTCSSPSSEHSAGSEPAD